MSNQKLIDKVLIPIRGIDLSKQRLRQDIDIQEVSIVISNLLDNLLEILSKFNFSIVILTADIKLKERLERKNIQVVLDPGISLNTAVNKAIDDLNHNYLLIMPDLPGITSKSIDKIISLVNLNNYVICPTLDNGTAACYLPGSILTRGLFGSNSAIKFESECINYNLDYNLLICNEFNHDLDSVEDWKYWEKQDMINRTK